MSPRPRITEPDDQGFLDWLQERNAYADGLLDGYAGDRIDEDLAVRQPEYRRGLSDGRTQRIDEHLRELAE